MIRLGISNAFSQNIFNQIQDQFQQRDSSADDDEQVPNGNDDDGVDMSGPLDGLKEGNHNKNMSTVDSIAISPETIQVRL